MFSKKCLIFVFNSIVSVYLAFFAFNKEEMFYLHGNFVFYFISICFFIWLYLLYKFFLSNINFQSFIKEHKNALFAATAITILFVLIFPPEYRILADEARLTLTSKSLSQLHTAFIPIETINMLDNELWLSYGMDKRPVLFSYIVSLIHTIKGYSYYNSFVLNAFTSFGCLFLIYYLIQTLWGKYYGLVSLICLASYPIFIEYSMSAGFDIFNLFFALLTFVIFCIYYKNKNALNMELLLYTILLLSQTRYESILMVIVIPFIVFFFLKQKKEIENLSYSFLMFPFFYIPVAWLIQFANTNYSLQVESNEKVFSIKYFIFNVKKAIEFFINYDSNYGTIRIFFILALFALIYVLFTLKNCKDQINRYFPHIFIIVLFLFIQIVVRLSYKLCDFTDPTASRLGTIFLPYIILGVVYVFKKAFYLSSINRKVWAFLFISFMFFNWCNIQRTCSSINTNGYHILKNINKFFEYKQPALNKKDYLIVAPWQNCLTIFNYNVVSISALNTDYNSIISNVKDKKLWKSVFVIQSVIKGDIGWDSVIDKNIKMHTIYEKIIEDGVYLRISELDLS